MNKHSIEEKVARAFASNVAGHRLIVRHDQGLYRHLVFEAREHSWNDRFEIITAPGSLTITGDRGGHVFRRLTDMFQFFRSNGHQYGINPGYWAEKLPDYGKSVKVYSEHAARQHLKDMLRDLAEEYRRDLADWRTEVAEYGNEADEKPEMPEVLRRARELVKDYDYELDFREGADQLLRELESIGAVSDTWEWDLSDWDYHFLHNLHAIAWGIQQYDRAVRLGLHKPQTGPMAYNVPLPTEAPQMRPKPGPASIKALVTLSPVVKTAAAVGGVL